MDSLSYKKKRFHYLASLNQIQPLIVSEGTKTSWERRVVAGGKRKGAD